MLLLATRRLPALLLAASLTAGVSPGTALAQGTGDRPADPQRQSTRPAEPSKDGPKSVTEFTEAARLLGGPAANPECVFHGRRVVILLLRDDVDTAFRHLDLYDRFGCPGGHVQATFRCLALQGNVEVAVDPKQADTIKDRAHACWVNPTQQAVAPAASGAAAAPTGQAPAGGTTTR